jgi:hypothetical protein
MTHYKQTSKKARFQVLIATSMKMAVFWDDVLCSLTDILEELNAFISRQSRLWISTRCLWKVQGTGGFRNSKMDELEWKTNNGYNFFWLQWNCTSLIHPPPRNTLTISNITELWYDIYRKMSNKISLEMAKRGLVLHHDNASATQPCLYNALLLRVKQLQTPTFLTTVLLSPSPQYCNYYFINLHVS